MKKLILSAVILLSCFTVKNASAQVSVSLGVNIGSQPAWGPVGYNYANYYYMPDIDTYYDVPTHQYVYFDNNIWVHRAYLPVRYRHYNLYNGYKVVINDRNPWLRHGYYRDHYAGFRGRHDQVIIRNSRDAHYANYWRGNYARRTAYARPHYNNGNHWGNRGGNRGNGNWGGNRGGGRGNWGGDRGNHGGDHGNHGGGRGPGGDHGGGHGGEHGHH
ncbi:hypothetical protein SAMN05421821_106137 [Mucilaginibacter lappiensis]|uniref:YXWGXW repeat-containing protein n=1 Tax=Mucilaginibacter lappiensis TaxID=354630 RepID=A0ABR6PKM7_9SPHI|nr:hypothetical protein [Mucilaginibacter lappiensis]MBB6110329.1 hypothetical protein [Mucilaginibacter lappiensis]SIR30558.1 hypothetical protein SAMN05421821_106137 [Mucilaginibacter lappiensis]